MPAGKWDIIIEQGSDFERTLSLKSGDGSDYSLVGYTARMQIRRSKTSSATILSISTADWMTITGNQIEIAVPASVTINLLPTNAVYDLEIVSPSGRVIRLVEGEATISAEVTR